MVRYSGLQCRRPGFDSLCKHVFFFFFTKNLSFFLASYDTLDDPCEGRRPCLERSSRRSLARAEGPV